MSPDTAAFFVILLSLPLNLLVYWQLRRLADRRSLQPEGVIIRRREIVQLDGVIVGHYRGHDIHGSLVFLGRRYQFDRIADAQYRVRQRELLLPPGLVYVTD
jgi:hypothetical protein